MLRDAFTVDEKFRCLFVSPFLETIIPLLKTFFYLWSLFFFFFREIACKERRNSMVRKQSDRFFIQTWYDIIYNVYIYICFSGTYIYAHGRNRVIHRGGGGAIGGLAKICLRHSWASASNTSALNQSIVKRRPDSVQVDSPLHDKSPFSFPTRGNRR